MTESNSQPEKPKKQRRFDPDLLKKGLRCDLDQYEMLKRCSEKKDMTEWNNWRAENPREEIWLQGLKFYDYLERAYLAEAHLEGAILCNANLKNAHLVKANLEGIDLSWSNLEGAIFVNSSLQKAKLIEAHLEETNFAQAHLESTDFSRSHLENANFFKAFLEGAKFKDSRLQGTILSRSHIKGSNFETSIVDGKTAFWKCKVDRYTNFSGVGLDSCRIDPATKQLLEYNIRRKNWEEWYENEDEPIRHGVLIFSNKKIRLKTNKILRLLVRKFWEISDYGISTKQLIKTFFQLAIIFAGAYLAWGLIDYHLIGIKDNPGIVSNLFILESNKESVSPWLVPIRAVYFSIVTMTTLGFGDMYANAHSFIRGLFGHVLLALQVILGYVLLGALVTRFAVLFTAGGPAGKFTDEKGEKDEKQRRN